MTTSQWVDIFGGVGGFCTTFAFVPQLVKIYKQGGRDLSYGMLSLYLFGVTAVAGLWPPHSRPSGGPDERGNRDSDRGGHHTEGPERAAGFEQVCRRRAIQRVASSRAVEAPKHHAALRTRS